MGRLNPYNLQMQITQMFTQGQSFFALTKVQDWGSCVPFMEN